MTPPPAVGSPEAAAGLLGLTALFAYLNHRLRRLPPSVGVMALARGPSALAVRAGRLVPAVGQGAVRMAGGIDSNRAVPDGLLGYLLFAGARRVNSPALARRRRLVGVLATLGVVSAAVVGGLAYLLLTALGLPDRPAYCLRFGALMSPTDPVAVSAVLCRADAPREVGATLAGESLLSDGVGVVLFLAVLPVAANGGAVDLRAVGRGFVREAAGGVGFGPLLGEDCTCWCGR